MTIHHHPSDETLMRLAAQRLGPGLAIVLSVHLRGCAVCRERHARFEAVGGVVLDDMPPAALAADLFARTMNGLDATERVKADAPVARNHPALGIRLPRELDDCEIGPWKWLGPGLKWSKVRVAGDPDAKLMLLKGRVGVRLPAHGHSGLEFTQILAGSLSDQRGLDRQSTRLNSSH